jgi:hypothetical protein
MTAPIGSYNLSINQYLDTGPGLPRTQVNHRSDNGSLSARVVTPVVTASVSMVTTTATTATGW